MPTHTGLAYAYTGLMGTYGICARNFSGEYAECKTKTVCEQALTLWSEVIIA